MSTPTGLPDTPGPQRVPLGRTGLVVPQVGFGTAPLGDFFELLDEDTAIGTVRAALASGMTLVDTSPHYGNGLAEHRVGTALRSVHRDGVVLSTKVGRVMSPAAVPGIGGPGRHGDSPAGCRTGRASITATTASCARSSNPC